MSANEKAPVALSDFNAISGVRLPTLKRRKRPPPFSLRLSEEEKDKLRSQANGVPLGAYIRSRLLAQQPGPGFRVSRHQAPDQKQLALILAALGRANLAANMDKIAKAADTGTLEASPELHAEIYSACNEIKMLRQILIAALGIKPEDGA